MKTNFFFRTLACVGAALLAVACFDDAPIWDEFEDLRGEMSQLESRLDTLEKSMEDNISAIQSMVSVGSIASWTYNAETGKGVITLVDGNKITIDQEIKGYSIITVEKGEDGVYYWALCADGETLPLVIDNKKVPVSVTPALKISEDSEWLISVDGGSTWVNTGISYYAEKTPEQEVPGDDQEPGDDSSDKPETLPEAVVFEKAEVVDGNTLVLTLVGGEQIKVAIVGEAVFKPAVEELWFARAGYEKSIAVETQNVKAYTVTEKPEGWVVNTDDSYIFITSPSNFTEYPTKGTVKILVLFDNGAQPDIVSINVDYEPMLTLARANGVVTVKLSDLTGEDFGGYVLTGWLKSDYTPEKLVAKLNAEHDALVVREGSQTYNLEDIIENFDPVNEYVVSAVPYLPSTQVAQGAAKYELTDVVSVETIAVESDWMIKNLKFDSADLHAVMPVTEYFGGFMDKETWELRGRTDILEMLNAGNLTPITEVVYDGPANGFPDGQVESSLNPATEYVIWYVPVDAKVSGKYAEGSFVEEYFVTPDVSADASIAAPTYQVRDLKSSGFTADVTPAANTYKTYAAIVKEIVIAEMTDDDIVRYVINASHSSEAAAVNTITTGSFDPNDTVYLLAVSISADGKYGALLKQVVALKPLSFTENLGVEVTGVEYDAYANVTLSLEFKGSPVTITYLASNFILEMYSAEVLQPMLAKGQYGEATTVEISKLGGKVTLSGLNVGEEYTFCAIVTDAQENHSYLYCDYKFVPTVQVEYVLSSASDYEYGMPKFTGKLTGNMLPKTYTLTVDKPAECVKYWLFCGDASYFTTDVYINTDMMLSMGLSLSGETVHEESTTVTYEIRYNEARIYLVWMDNKNRCHVIKVINPFK